MGKKIAGYVLWPLAVIMVLALVIQLADPHLNIWGSFWDGLGMIFRPFGQFLVDVWRVITGNTKAFH